jgi:hypothetical protein
MSLQQKGTYAPPQDEVRGLNICDRTAQNNSVLSPKPVHMTIKQ